MLAIFIDRNPFDGEYENVKLEPVLDENWDDAVVSRARKNCPKWGRLVELPVLALPMYWETYDQDKMRLTFYASKPSGKRRWTRTGDEVIATIPAKPGREALQLHTVLYVETSA